MSGDPTRPGAPAAPETPAAQGVPTQPGASAATVPGIPSVMPGAHFAIPPMPAAAMPGAPMGLPVAAMPAGFAPMAPAMAPAMVAPMAPAPVAAPAGPVLGVRDHYQFGEEPVGQKVQITLLETPKLPAELPSPTKIDPGLEATRVALEAQLARNAIAPLPYVPPTATRWFRFSPLELFMEHVLARRLWTVE